MPPRHSDPEGMGSVSDETYLRPAGGPEGGGPKAGGPIGEAPPLLRASEAISACANQ